jgi:hypothetical protein
MTTVEKEVSDKWPRNMDTWMKLIQRGEQIKRYSQVRSCQIWVPRIHQETIHNTWLADSPGDDTWIEQYTTNREGYRVASLLSVEDPRFTEMLDILHACWCPEQFLKGTNPSLNVQE